MRRWGRNQAEADLPAATPLEPNFDGKSALISTKLPKMVLDSFPDW